MRSSQGITVHEAVVHLITPAKGEMTLSSAVLSLNGTGTTKIGEYLAAHVENGLHDAAARTARFRRAQDESRLLPVCTKLVDEKTPLLPGSREIAAQLRDASDKRVSNGALVVCFYTARNYPRIKRFLAILKLEPADGFRPVTVYENGVTLIRLEVVENVVPSTGERLLKSAFIQPRPVGVAAGSYQDYDLMVLDRQKPGRDEPAQFFTRAFLGAESVQDAAELTRRFYIESLGGLRDIREQITEKKAETIRTAIEAAVSGAEIDIDEWTGNLSLPKPAKETILARLSAKIPDRSFQTDQDLGTRLIKKRVFRGDHGFRLQFDADSAGQILVSQRKLDGCEELILHVQNLREVER